MRLSKEASMAVEMHADMTGAVTAPAEVGISLGVST